MGATVVAGAVIAPMAPAPGARAMASAIAPQIVAGLKSAGVDVDVTHITEGVVSAIRSFYITFSGFALGVTIEAVTLGGQNTVLGVLAYAKLHWVVWTVTNVLTPAWRGTAAYRAAKAAGTPGPPS